MAQWILSNSLLDTWTKIKKALIDTFGIPVAQQKQTCRAKLESLRQGNLPSRQFKASFEAIIQELPEGVTLPVELLRSIYMCATNPRLLKKIIGQISSSSTWINVADKAIAMDEVLLAAPRLAAAQLYTQNDVASAGPVIQNPVPSGPTPMEIDAFHQKPGSYNCRQSASQVKSKNKFNQWVRPGCCIHTTSKVNIHG